MLPAVQWEIPLGSIQWRVETLDTSKPSFHKCGGLDVVEVQSRMLHEGEMGFIRLASTIKLVSL